MTESYVPAPPPTDDPAGHGPHHDPDYGRDHGHSEPPVTTGPWGALIRILFSPADALALIRVRAPWLPPYLLLGLVAAATAVVTLFVIGDAITQEIGATPELAEIGFPTGGLVAVMAVIGGAFAFVAPAISGLIFALVLYIAGLIFNNKATFAQLFSLAGYAEMPAFVGMLVGLVLIVVAPEQAATFNLSLAVLWPGAPLLITTLLSLISPFTLWTWVLVALGLSHVGQVPARQAWWQTVTVFAAVALTKLAFGSLATGLANLAPTLPM